MQAKKRPDFSDLLKFYANNLGNVGRFDREYDECKQYWVTGEVTKKSSELPSLVSTTNPIRFPRTYKLPQILLVIPVFTASEERSFSNLRRVQTYLRSNMGGELLNAVGMLNIHKTIKLDPAEVVSIYLSR